MTHGGFGARAMASATDGCWDEKRRNIACDDHAHGHVEPEAPFLLEHAGKFSACAANRQPVYLPQRAFAAFLAIALRLVGLKDLARAFPPARPPRRMCSFAGSGFTSSTSPVAIRMMWTALPITSAGRFSPLGPFGIEAESSTTRRRVNGADRGAGNQTVALPGTERQLPASSTNEQKSQIVPSGSGSGSQIRFGSGKWTLRRAEAA